MNQSLLPVALGLLTVVAVPLPGAANDSPTPPSAPVSDPEAASAMPVAQELSYAEPSGALNFEPVSSGSPGSAIAARPAAISPHPADQPQTPAVKRDFGGTPAATEAGAQNLFEGGSESLVARTVGAAEGTRTADGGKTQNYHGHVDPGNGVWNRGTFSYQFGNAENLSPDEADRRQLAKIKRIYESVMLPKAATHGIAPLTLEEEINGIDLINQAPLTVTEAGGYIERLAEAKQKGLAGDEAILRARIWSFWDGAKGGWDAPGLRAYDDISKEESIRRDQDRRMGMIAQALAAYRQENGSNVAHGSVPGEPQPQAGKIQAEPSQGANRNAIADAIISGEMPVARG